MRPLPGQKAPALDVPMVHGGRWQLDAQRPARCTMMVFYRGLHCPICRAYLIELTKLVDDFAARRDAPPRGNA